MKMNTTILPLVVAKLIFDTYAQPLPRGVRSGAVTARQLLYEAERLTVDLRLDSQPHTNKICAVGQVIDKRVPRASLRNASIMLWTEMGLPLVETLANEFGEFHLEFEPQNQLRLNIHIYIVGQPTIRIPVGKIEAWPAETPVSGLTSQSAAWRHGPSCSSR